MINTSSNQLQEVNQKPFDDKAETGQRYFVISRGKTQHPRREIRSCEYLIGSGNGCDLRLGGTEIPSLHSAIHFEGGISTIESGASLPALIVNGTQVETHELADGDLIQIGPFELEFRQESVPVNNKLPIPQADLESSSDEPAFDISDLTAEELVSLLEADMQFVEENEAQNRNGLEALTAEVESRIPNLETNSTEPEIRRDEIVEEFVQITNKLCEHVTRLEERVSNISKRDSVYSNAFSDLLDSQKLLSDHLGALISHLASLEQSQDRSQSSRFAA